jgi:hypothetical protein
MLSAFSEKLYGTTHWRKRADTILHLGRTMWRLIPSISLTFALTGRAKLQAESFEVDWQRSELRLPKPGACCKASSDFSQMALLGGDYAA